MAQRVTTTYDCDLEGKHEGDVATRNFTVGSAREIDLCAKHNAQFERALAPFVEASRRISGRAPLQRRTPGYSRNTSVRARQHEIREWAKAQGRQLSDRGRIPVSVIQDYEAAHVS